jgi:hypothetical protein
MGFAHRVIIICNNLRQYIADNCYRFQEPVGFEESKRSGLSRQAAKRLLAKFGWARADFAGFAGQ